MTYATGLGQFNIAVSSSDAVRRFLAAQRYGTFGTRTTTAPVAPAPSPWPTVTRTTTFVPRTTTTFKPVISTMPVLKPAAPTLKPVVSTAYMSPTQQVSGGASPTIADESAAMSAMSPSKSPLPLILAGLAALFLLNRKKGR